MFSKPIHTRLHSQCPVILRQVSLKGNTKTRLFEEPEFCSAQFYVRLYVRFNKYTRSFGAWGSVVVKALRY